jgi:hypothetical protein
VPPLNAWLELESRLLNEKKEIRIITVIWEVQNGGKDDYRNITLLSLNSLCHSARSHLFSPLMEVRPFPYFPSSARYRSTFTVENRLHDV